MNMERSLLSVSLIIILARLSHGTALPRVNTTQGIVVGTARQTEDGNMIYSFLGIPYIKPPIGDLRFKPPQPPEPWTGDFFATSDEVVCVQNVYGPLTGTEDCVILNVHTPWDPASPPSKPLSVMVFIHGGGFVGGWSGASFVGHPDYLLHHDVVLVTINYRLGVMGFLSTEDQAAPGNYGLLDQIEALRWIKNNIASFGGNPDDVTIFGESAGGASVQFLMLSPQAKGLFHRAIAQSGSSISPFSSTLIAKKNAQTIAEKVGCPEEPSEELLDCLRRIDADQLIRTEVKDPDKKIGMIPFVWSPRVDAEATDPFLPEHPIELMRSGKYHKVPFLIGHTRTEGGMFMTLGKEDYEIAVEGFTKRWDLYCKLNLGMTEYMVPENLGSELCRKVNEAYIDSSKGFEENRMGYAAAFTDAIGTASSYKTSELMSSHSPVYNYLFNYESQHFFWMKLLFPSVEKVEGVVSHLDDLLYLFKYPQTGWTKESPEYNMVQMMTYIWTEFAKTGQPPIPKLNAPWPRASWPNHKYVVIDTQPSIQQNYRPDKLRLFEEIYNKYLYKTVFNERDEL